MNELELILKLTNLQGILIALVILLSFILLLLGLIAYFMVLIYERD